MERDLWEKRGLAIGCKYGTRPRTEVIRGQQGNLGDPFQKMSKKIRRLDTYVLPYRRAAECGFKVKLSFSLRDLRSPAIDYSGRTTDRLRQ